VKSHIRWASVVLVIATVAGLAGVGVASAFPNAGPVVAFDTTVPLQADDGVVIAYTVTDFKPSPEAAKPFASDICGKPPSPLPPSAAPILLFFNAAISPAAIPEGATSTGKVYFDCNGSPPAMVVYNDGTQDLLTWQ
jgi:hypothetical protein